MHQIRVVGFLVLVAVSTSLMAGAPAPTRPAAVDRCTAGGATCVESIRRVSGERVETEMRVHPTDRPATIAVPRRPVRLIVESRPGAPPAATPTIGSMRHLPRSGVTIVELRDGTDEVSARAALATDPAVLSVESDSRVHVFETVPEDPLWIEQWGLRKIEAPAAWDHGTDVTELVVAVIDTGVDLEHRDLGDSLWVAPDGTRGYNCVTGNEDVQDDHGHGTHVAGVIGASANADGVATNDHGIAGVSWRAKIYPMKFLDAFGFGLASDAIACFERIAELNEAGANIRVTNNSWGGFGRTPLLRRAMAQLARAGVVHVTAAGNDGLDNDLEPIFPSSWKIPGLISVGSSGISDVPSPFSNHGLATVDLAAPGEYVMSTVPSDACPSCSTTGYAYGSGTSAAAPHVAGVVAAIIQTRPDWKPRQVRDLLLDPASTAPSALDASASGRLDFARVRAALDAIGPVSPVVNRHPRFVQGRIPPQFVSDGERLEVDVSAFDPDPTDPVEVRVRRAEVADFDTLAPLAWMIGERFPQPPPGGPFVLDGARVSRPASVPYVASTADGRGGSSRRRFVATMLPDGTPDDPPTADLVLSSTGSIGTTVELTTSALDPDGGSIAWGYECHGSHGGFSAFEPHATSYSRPVWVDGRFRCRAYVVDDELNLTVSPDVELQIGSDTRRPPRASLELDRTDGPLPLTVQLDATTSSDADGSIESYSFACGNEDVLPATATPTASCTFTRPGPHVVRVTVIDDDLRTDSIAIPVMAYPAATPVVPAAD